jgi:AcrR family transcriptional regulator
MPHHPPEPSHRPRRRRRRKSERPAEIVAAALELWAERGFAATRLEDVASRAGIAKGTIYLYFASKEALFASALRDLLVSTMEQQREEMESFEGDTATLLDRFLAVLYQRVVADRAAVLLKVLIAEGHRFPELVELYRGVAFEHGFATVRGLLERGDRRGDLREGAATLDPRLLIAPVLIAAIWEMVFGRTDAERSIALEAWRRQHLELLLHGLLRTSPAPSLAGRPPARPRERKRTTRRKQE